MFEAKAQRAAVTFAHTFEAMHEAALRSGEDIVSGGILLAVLALEKVHGHGRHQGSREQIRGQHGENHGLGQGHEEKLARRR